MKLLEFLAYVSLGMGVSLLGKTAGLDFLTCYSISAILVLIIASVKVTLQKKRESK